MRSVCCARPRAAGTTLRAASRRRRRFERFSYDLVGGGDLGDVAVGIAQAPLAAAIPLLAARSPLLLRSMPWRAGRGLLIAAGIPFVVGWLGPLGLRAFLGVAGIVTAYAPSFRLR